MGRGRRIVSSALGLSPPRGAFGSTLRLALRAGVLLFAIEQLGARLAREPTPPLGPLGTGASLGLTLLAALAVGSVVATLARVWVAAQGPHAAAGTREMLFGQDPVAQRHRSIALLAGTILLPAYGVAAFLIARAIIGAMARAHFAAVTVVFAHLVLLLVAALFWPVARMVGAALASLLARVAPTAWLLERVGRLLIALVLAGLVGGAAMVAVFWSTFQFMPWELIVPLTLVALLAPLLTWAVDGRRPLFLSESGVLLLAVVVGALSLLTLDGRSAEGRRAMHRTLGGRAGQAVALALLDFDRDGHLHVLGGRDCAPFDVHVSPVAADIPNNGIDEDCDGADLNPESLRLSMRRDWPVPGAFPKRPPIVLITVDAFAANRLAALGGTRGNTPRIDALAREGTLFTACFSQGPSTRLSFPSIMTSRWDSQIARRVEGKHPFPFESSEITLAEVLSKAGYATTAIVADRYFTRARWRSITDGFDQVIESPVKVSQKGQHNSKQVTDASIAALGRHSAKRPLFLWSHYYDAHSPHRQPEQGVVYGTTREDVYDAELALVDAEVGRLVDGIRKRLGKEALIVLTADHGIAFDAPRHAKFNYGYDLYSAVLHVPLIVVGPGIQRGTIGGAVSTMDVAPTLANLLRIRRRLPFEGASLVPELLEGRSARPERMMHQFYITERLQKDQDPLEMASLRSGRYHLIHDRRIDSYELYDYRADQLERNDLSSSASAAGAFDALRQQLALYTYRLHHEGRAKTHRDEPAGAH